MSNENIGHPSSCQQDFVENVPLSHNPIDGRHLRQDDRRLMDEPLGQSIARRREGLGISQAELAALADSMQSQVSEIETGKIKSGRVARRLGRALDKLELERMDANTGVPTRATRKVIHDIRSRIASLSVDTRYEFMRLFAQLVQLPQDQQFEATDIAQAGMNAAGEERLDAAKGPSVKAS